MLFVKFQLGSETYLVEATGVVEVLPLVEFKQVPQAPAGVLGLFNYRGRAVPAVDLAMLALGRPAAQLMSTRLLLVRYRDPSSNHGSGMLLGVVAERVNETVQLEASDFQATGIDNEDAPYLGPVTRQGQHIYQRIDIHRLLSEAMQDVLREAVEEGA